MKETYDFQNVDRSSYKPIYIQVSEMIIEYATHLELGPGDALPSENKLLSMLDVSRNTIRQAVDRLVKMNFAEKFRGQGTFIKKKSQAINLDLSQGFEGSLYKLGIKVENRLAEKRVLENRMEWMEGLGMISEDTPVLIRRIKQSSGKVIALEDRVLPARVVGRYSEEELESENINPNLLEKYPDTESSRMTYAFVSKPLTADEADLLDIRGPAPFLQRIGEYYNPAGECFMLGRHIFISTRINVRYEFEKTEGFWILT